MYAAGRLLIAMFLAFTLHVTTAHGSAHAQDIFAGFTGQLLVASPRMPDPRFSNTVIFIVVHTQDGAAGVIVNRPTAIVPLADMYELAGINEPADDTEITVFTGGPVALDVGQVLHLADFVPAERSKIDDTFSITDWRSFLRHALNVGRPDRAIFTLGLSTWGPGQLEREVIDGAWTSRLADPDLIFETNPEDLWDVVSAAPGSPL